MKTIIDFPTLDEDLFEKTPMKNVSKYTGGEQKWMTRFVEKIPFKMFG